MGYYEEHAEKAVKQNVNIDHYPKIEGYDYEQAFDLTKFMEAYVHTGIQASNLGRAVEIVKQMRTDGATIFLGYTSNMVSCGVREAIAYLVKHKLVDVLVTTAGAIEEDYIKCFKHFVLGDFEVPGRTLLEAGIQRTGNIFVPIDRYTVFEQTFVPFLEKLWADLHERGETLSSRTLLQEMGRYLAAAPRAGRSKDGVYGDVWEGVSGKEPEDSESAILYWAAKNSIPYFCPAVTDGALGDMLYFFKQRHKEFLFDTSADMKDLVDIGLNSGKVGLIIVGGGVAKHHLLNAMVFREGAEYVVSINTHHGYDASDSGANVQEAISWGKVKPNAEHVKVLCDGSIAFPLLVAAAFPYEG